MVGNWTAESPDATKFRIEFHGVPPEHSLCLQVLSEIASPVFWFGAREVSLTADIANDIRFQHYSNGHICLSNEMADILLVNRFEEYYLHHFQMSAYGTIVRHIQHNKYRQMQ